MNVLTYEGQKTTLWSQFPFYITWVPGNEIRSTGLCGKRVLAEPYCQPRLIFSLYIKRLKFCMKSIYVMVIFKDKLHF